MVSALNLIGSNSELQSHWLRRLIALIIDWFIMLVIWIIIGVGLAMASFFLPGGFIFIPFFSGIMWILYSGVLEGTGGATIGKHLLNLRVVAVQGQMDIFKGLFRNLTKIWGYLLILDWIIGFIMEGDPRQRLLDRMANTTVVRTDIQELIPGAYQPGGGVMPAPMPPMQPQPQYGPQPGQPPQYQQPPQQPYQAQQPAQPEPVEKKMAPIAENASTGTGTYARSELLALKKDELVKIAKDKGLMTSGTKRDLIDRILGEGD